MTTMSEPLAFTDDELVALALRAERVWASPLPTLGDVDTEGLLAAAARGWRSLNVRGLVDRDELRAVERTVLAPALENEVMGRTCCTDDDGNVTAIVPTSSFYRQEPDRWLVELVTPDGIHTFSSAPAATCLGLIREAAQDAVTNGIEVVGELPVGVTRPVALCIAAVDGSNVRLVLVRKNDVQVQTGAEVSPSPAADVDAAFREVGLQ